MTVLGFTYFAFQYQAKSWEQSRRVVAKVEWQAGELFPRVGFAQLAIPPPVLVCGMPV